METLRSVRMMPTCTHVEGSKKIGAVIALGRSYVDEATTDEAVYKRCLGALLPGHMLSFAITRTRLFRCHRCLSLN